MKVIGVRKDGDRERAPVPLSRGDKRIGEWRAPALFQFNREGMLGIGKSSATQSRLWTELLIDFQSTCRDIILKIGKVHFFDDQRVEAGGKGWIVYLVRFWIASMVARECFAGPPQMRSLFETGADLGLVKSKKLQAMWKIVWSWINSQFYLLQISPQRKCIHSKTDQIQQRRPTLTGCHTFSKRISGRFLFLLLEIKQHWVLFALKLTKFWEPHLFKNLI